MRLRFTRSGWFKLLWSIAGGVVDVRTGKTHLRPGEPALTHVWVGPFSTAREAARG